MQVNKRILLIGAGFSANFGGLLARDMWVDIKKGIAVLNVERPKIPIEQYDTEAVSNFTENFLLDHDKRWLNMGLRQKQILQSEMFPRDVLVENRKIRTLSLDSSFGLI